MFALLVAKTIMTAAFDTFFSEIAAAIGTDAVNRSEETLRPARQVFAGPERQAGCRPLPFASLPVPFHLCKEFA